MYECFRCLQRTVIWDGYFDYEDFGYNGDGIIHVCHCTHCGAKITYDISLGENNHVGH